MLYTILIPATKTLNIKTEVLKQALANKEILSHTYKVKRITGKVYQC